MSDTTVTRKALTRFAPLPIAVVHSDATRLALLTLLILSASGCDSNSSVAPTGPTPPSPTFTPTFTTVRLEGRVLDEHNQPVEGATITPHWPPARGPAPSTTADATGSFSLTLDWPANWPSLTLNVHREGYEGISTPVPAAESTPPLLINIYRSLTISSGESIQTTVSLRSYGPCGFEPLCRRAVVNSPSGKPVDIEVLPADGEEYAGLALSDQLEWGFNFPSRVTVPGGAEVWIVVRQPGWVTVGAVDR